jgi:hypothetical protein
MCSFSLLARSRYSSGTPPSSKGAGGMVSSMKNLFKNNIKNKFTLYLLIDKLTLHLIKKTSL